MLYVKNINFYWAVIIQEKTGLKSVLAVKKANWILEIFRKSI